LKIEFRNAHIRVHGLYSREGSVLAGDIEAFADSINTELTLDSDEPPERVQQLIKLAESSCFTIAALRKPTPVELSVTLNGEKFELDD
jgi:organic hydroperoxide reductase OsmC/OhrA